MNELWTPLNEGTMQQGGADAERAIQNRTGNPDLRLFVAEDSIDGVKVFVWILGYVPNGDITHPQAQVIYAEPVVGRQPNVPLMCDTVMRYDRVRVPDPIKRNRKEAAERSEAVLGETIEAVADDMKTRTKLLLREYTPQ